ncbi:MAG: peptide ABC transporter substrate-binding protein [Thermaerobacter sp.]|nr:peptide ABC transporter substrate-binding protein [Thermaerobacter sp.]
MGPVLAGCGTSPQTTTTAAPSKTVVIALAAQTAPNWFFPVLASTGYTDTNSQMNFLMYKPLVDISKTDSVDYRKSLAKSITSNATGTNYTIQLNPKYRWSNGRPVTAQDVVFTWDIMKAASGNGALPWTYGGAGGGGVPADWTSVSAVNASTVVVTLAHPANQSWFIHNGLGQIIPVPKAVWDKFPNNMTTELSFIKSVANVPTAPEYNVVDGPYKFLKMAPNQYWQFVPNPRYGGHRSQIQRVVFQYETSATSEFSGLKTGSVNVGYLPPSMWASRTQLTADHFWPAYLFGFNMARVNQSPQAQLGLGPAFSQSYVRAALEMGINQQGIINSIYHGQGVAEDGPVPSEPPTEFYDPALAKAPYAYNPKAGQALLQSHGWRLVNGVMTLNGMKLAFPVIYTSGSQSVKNTVELLKQDWAKEGIQVSLVPQPFDNVIATMHGNPSKWDMAYWGGGWTYQPDYYPTGGELFATGAAANAGHYNSTQMDSLIQNSYAPGTPSQTQAALFAYEAFAVRDIPYLWFPLIPQLNENSTTVHGVASTFNPITALMSPNYWTVGK